MWPAIEALILVSALLFAWRERRPLHRAILAIFVGAASGMLIVDVSRMIAG